MEHLKHQPPTGLFVGGVNDLLVLAVLGPIDAYEFVVHPRLVSRLEFAQLAVAKRHGPAR